MKLLGLEVKRYTNLPKFSSVACFHCGKTMQIKIENMRAYNYCSGC